MAQRAINPIRIIGPGAFIGVANRLQSTDGCRPATACPLGVLPCGFPRIAFGALQKHRPDQMATVEAPTVHMAYDRVVRVTVDGIGIERGAPGLAAAHPALQKP